MFYMSFLHEDYLLENESARFLYHDVARHLPIIDYHCHLNPGEIAENRRFKNLYEAWLEGDHYKWRAMRANGVSEEFCTGDADPFDKFKAFAATVPHTLRNPLYHWSHIELRRYFGYHGLLNEDTAGKVWELANRQLQEDLDVGGILKKFRVEVVCTTDDPVDSLEAHRKIATQKSSTRVYPAFRPDKVFAADQQDTYNTYLNRLQSASGVSISTYAQLLEALEKRHSYFHENGCRLSDHGMNTCFASPCSEKQAEAIFAKARAGKGVTVEEKNQLATALMLWLGERDAERGWTRQLHLGAQRNNNTRKLREVGPDTGFDSIGDWEQSEALSWYLDQLDQKDKLPRMILYNLNPKDNYVLAAMIGNFQDGVIPGKIQFGSGWWFNDQKEGMEAQINALSNLGLLSHFVGMLTDSRSFLSFPRHEYFRRILCNLVGRDMTEGLLPDDPDLIHGLIRRVCYENARDFFRFPK